MRKVLLILVYLACTVDSIYVTTIHVPADQPTIQAGIDAAVDGDTVLLANGTYTGSGNRDMSFGGKAIVVTSESGRDFCTIDVQSSSSEYHRAFLFDSGEDSFSVLQNVTIRGGYAPYSGPAPARGGAIACVSATPQIQNCLFAKNYATSGGAIYFSSGELYVSDCVFDTNSAGPGAGIFASDAARLTLQNCLFRSNLGGNGGAVNWSGDSLFILDCQFEGNRANTQGGIVVAGEYGASYVVIERCIISGTRGHGPNLYIMATAIIEDCVVADGTGVTTEPLFILGDSSVVRGCLIANNFAGYEPPPVSPILFVGSGSKVEQCTFARNGNGVTSSIVEFDDVVGEVLNSIIAHNLSAAAVGGQVVEIRCSNLFGNSGGDWVGPAAGQQGLNGNVSVDPLFCDTAAAIYYLQDASPCRPESTGCGLMGALLVGCAGAVVSNLLVAAEVSDRVADESPTLAWSVSFPFSQSSFEIEVGDDPDWLVAEKWQPGPIASPDTFVVYSGLALVEGASYFARVRVGDGAAWSNWTETSFRMNSTPPPAVQISPIDFAEVNTPLPTFSAVVQADAEGDSQQVQFGIYIDDSILIEESPLVPALYAQAGDTVEWMPTTPLNENWFYFWIMRSWDGYEYSAWNWGAMELFVVNAQNEAPPAAALYDPQGDAIVYTQHPSFAWTPVSDIDPYDTVVYDFRVSIDSEFVFAAEVDGLTDTTYAVASALESGRRYWWKVESRDNDGLSAPSAVERFRTYHPGDVNGTWTVNAADIIAIVNRIFKYESFEAPDCAADVNANGAVNAADIIYLVNYVFKGGAAPQAGCG